MLFNIKSLWFRLSGYSKIAIIIALAVTLITYVRLHFGVDFTDESYYVALAYRFTLGAKPFVDELKITQLPAILTLPFVKVYCWLVGGPDGIILFTRKLYLVFNLMVAGSVFLAIKKILEWPTALLIAWTCVVFIPFNIPNLSYNTFACGFFTAGCFLGVWVRWSKKSIFYLAIPGLCHGLAVFSYPTMLIPVLLYAFLLVSLSPSRKLSVLLNYGCGAAPVALLLLTILLKAGTNNVLTAFYYTRSVHPHEGIEKIVDVFQALWSFYPYKVGLLLLLLSLYFGIKIKLPIATFFLLLPLVPLPILYSGYTQGAYGFNVSLGYLFYYSLLSPYLLLMVGEDLFLKQLFYMIWIPSFTSAIFITYTSGNGYFNIGLGMLGSSLITTVLLVKLFLSLVGISNNLLLKLRNGQIVAPFLVLLILVILQYSTFTGSKSVYRDDEIVQLNTKVDSGAFSGLYTTQEKKNYLAELYNDLKSVCRAGDKILFFDNFPAGYLLTSMPPLTNSTWLDSKYYYPDLDKQIIVNYIHENLHSSLVVVKIKKLFMSKSENLKQVYAPNDLLNNMIESPEYLEVVSRDNYSIYRNRIHRISSKMYSN